MKAFFTNIHLPVIRGAASSTLLAHETPVAAAAHKTAIPSSIVVLLVQEPAAQARSGILHHAYL